MLMRGIAGNWMICLANFFGVMNKSFGGKVLGIGLGITLFGTIGYDHAVVNWNILTMAKVIQPSAFSWTLYFECCILTTIGNMIGVVFLMGFPAALTVYLDKFYYNKPQPPPPAKTEDENEVELEELPFEQPAPARPSTFTGERPKPSARQSAEDGKLANPWSEEEGRLDAPRRKFRARSNGNGESSSLSQESPSTGSETPSSSSPSSDSRQSLNT
jgi:hypothetical protein